MFKNLKHKSIIISWFLNFYQNRLTAMGRQLVNLGFILSILSSLIFYGTFLLYSIIIFFGAIFLLSPLIQWFFKPRFRLDVKTPGRAAAGSSVTEEFLLKNDSAKTAYFTFVNEDKLPEKIKPTTSQGMLVPLLPPGEEIKFRLELLCEKRGAYMLEAVRVDSAFPLCVLKTGVTVRQKRDLLIYPNFKPLLTFDIPAGKKLQPGGIALASNIGESMEFLGIREFRDGDSPRYIHWTSWARLNKPIVKEFHEEYFTRVALLIDTYIPDFAPESDYDAFESSLSLAASISDYLERQEYIIDIIAAGPEIYYLQAGRSLAYLDQILDILACLDVCRMKPYGDIEPHLMGELSGISTMIVLLLDWDDERRDFLLRMKDLGVEMKIFLVQNREVTTDFTALESDLGRVTILNSGDMDKGIDFL